MPAKITQVSFWPVQPPRFRTAKGGSIMEHTEYRDVASSCLGRGRRSPQELQGLPSNGRHFDQR